MEHNYWKIDYKKLPSLGKLYPSGSSIRFRCLSMHDLKYLAGMNENNAREMVNDILVRVLRLDGLEMRDILLMDRLSIIFWIRTNTFMLSNGYQTEFTCPFCQSRVMAEFGTSELHVKRITESVMSECMTELSDKPIKTVYKRIFDPYHQTGDTEVDDILNWTDIDTLLAGKSDQEMKDAVEALPANEYSKLKHLAIGAKCGILGYADLSCSTCRKALRVGVNIRDSVLFNKMKMATMIRNQIQVSKYCGIVLTDDMPYNEIELTIGIVNEMSRREAEAMQKRGGK